MKKLTLLAIFISGISFAQVGIGTTSPEETLDVNGTTRIESLGVGNVLNNGISSAVGVDSNGTLILIDKSESNTILVNSTNILPFPIGLETNNSGDNVSSIIYTTTITVLYPRLVEIICGTSATVYNNSFYNVITDGQNRLIGSKLIVDGVIRDEDREMYVNHDDDETVVTGYLYLKNSTKMFLAAGVHTIEISAFVLGGGRTYAEFGPALTDVFEVIQY